MFEDNLAWGTVRSCQNNARRKAKKRGEQSGMRECKCYHKEEERGREEERRGKRRRGRGGEEVRRENLSCFPNSPFPPFYLVTVFLHQSNNGYLHVCMLLKTPEISPPPPRPPVEFKSLLHFLMWPLITSCLMYFPKVLTHLQKIYFFTLTTCQDSKNITSLHAFI